MGLHLDVQIVDQLRQVLIDGDGSFSHTFIPKTPTDLIQLFNASVEPDMIGDNVLTQLRLVVSLKSSRTYSNSDWTSLLFVVTLKLKSPYLGMAF